MMMARTLKTKGCEPSIKEVYEMNNLNADATLIDFISEWLVVVKKNAIKPSTYERLETSARALANYPLAKMKVGLITSKDFHIYVDQLLDAQLRSSTIRKQMQIVSAPLRYAFEQRIIDFNPCVGVRTPSDVFIKKKSRQILAYSPDEQNKLHTVFETREYFDYDIPEFIIETGLRIGEVLALKWSDVQLQRRRINIHATMVCMTSGKAPAHVQEGAKSKASNRVVPLSLKAVAILERQCRCHDDDFVFSRDGQPVNYMTLRNHIQYACKQAEVKYQGMHVFRHTFATNQYYKGTDVKVLSRILGHAQASVTYNIYIHLYGDGFEDMLNAVS